MIEQTEQRVKELESVESYLNRLTSPLNYDSSTLESVEHQIEDQFRKTCDTLEDNLGGNNYESLTAYRFFGKVSYLIEKNKKLEKLNKKIK